MNDKDMFKIRYPLVKNSIQQLVIKKGSKYKTVLILTVNTSQEIF